MKPSIRTTLLLIGLVALMMISECIAPVCIADTAAYQKPPRYYITPTERTEIERTVAAESIGEPFEGQLGVASCILNAAEQLGIRPTEVLLVNRYTSNRVEPTESVREAVAAIFDRGEEITREPIVYFYAPAWMSNGVSKFHESQTYVFTIGGHRFFKTKEDNPNG